MCVCVCVHWDNIGNEELDNLWSKGIIERENSHREFRELAEHLKMRRRLLQYYFPTLLGD